MSHPQRSSTALTRRAGRIALAIALPCAALLAALGGPQRAVAQAPAPAVPAFAAVPRIVRAGALAASLPASLGRSQAGGTCNPGSATVRGNVVSLALHLKRVATSINNPSDPLGRPDPLDLRTYSGFLTSPEIDAVPGDSLHIALANELSTTDPTAGPRPRRTCCCRPAWAASTPPTCTRTGSTSRPAGISDNVLLAVAPATVQPYVIDIPKDHPAGTFWYHAHMHGSTAVDVSSAVAGTLIVRGNRAYDAGQAGPAVADIDTILHGADRQPFPDTVFVLQQLAYGCFWTTDRSKPYDNLITTAGLFTTADSQAASPPPSASAPWTCRPSSALPSGRVLSARGVVENFQTAALLAHHLGHQRALHQHQRPGPAAHRGARRTDPALALRARRPARHDQPAGRRDDAGAPRRSERPARVAAARQDAPRASRAREPGLRRHAPPR